MSSTRGPEGLARGHPARGRPGAKRRLAERWGSVIAVFLLLLGVVALATLLPPAPNGPRFDGAGSAEPRPGGTLVFHEEVDLRTLDPQLAFDTVSAAAVNLLFDNLLEYDRETLALRPRLLAELPSRSDDGLRYRLRLRDGLRFADSPAFPGGRGRALTADDVRFTLERILRPETGSPGATLFANLDGAEAFAAGRASRVRGIRVLDRLTLELRLQRVDQTFVHSLAMGRFASPVARECFRKAPDHARRAAVGVGAESAAAGTGAESALVGIGAYRLEQWEPGTRVTFKRNPNYHHPTPPYLDRLVFELNLDRRAAAMRFRNGDLDHVHRFTPADQLVFSTEGWRKHRFTHTKPEIWGLLMNCGLPPFDNRHVRRAVAFAFNFDRFNRSRNHRYLRLDQPIPPGFPGHDPALLGRHRHDLEKAREEMRKAGYPAGIDQAIDLWVGKGATGRAAGELLQADLAEIGIRVRVKQVAFPVYLRETATAGRVHLHLGGWSMDYPDPANFFDPLFHSRAATEVDASNRAFYRNPEVDRLLDRARQESETDARLALYREAAAMVVDDAPWAFLFVAQGRELVQPYVMGYRPHPVYPLFFRDAWLDLPRRRKRSSRLRLPFVRWAQR